MFEFLGFSENLRNELAVAGQFKSFSAGEILCKPGDITEDVTLVAKGYVKLSLMSSNGSKQMLYFLEPGMLCGVSVYSTVVESKSKIFGEAESDVEMLVIPGKAVAKLRSENGEWNAFVSVEVKDRMEKTMMRLDEVSFDSLSSRLLKYLKEYSRMTDSMEIAKSHLALAQDLNSSREVISKLLKKMELDGEISMGHGSIWLILTHTLNQNDDVIRTQG
ncbi:MAG: Crp/Fnr family transcriptional regulator [Flavobacteriales bacterium]|nr:Crp/Fnr family transcriptional regulator [Flavobacteriales bacterium]